MIIALFPIVVSERVSSVSGLSHFNGRGEAVMVDVSNKEDTVREAKASGKIYMKKECLHIVLKGTMGKGDVLGTARIASIMGAKKTSEIIPLCHILNLTKIETDFEIDEKESSITALCTAKTTGKTGVEMEALTGVSVALLTIYDMCKAVDKTMKLGDIRLLSKSGGKSGHWEAVSEG